jgi:cell division septation protein DedD
MRGRAFVAFAAIGAALTLGCNPASRHDALTFFFDGVDEPVQDRWEHERAMRAAAYALEGRDDGREPYAMNPCSECHASPETRYASVPPNDRERAPTAPAIPSPIEAATSGDRAAMPASTGARDGIPARPGEREAVTPPFVIVAPRDETPAPPPPPPAPKVSAAPAAPALKASPDSLAGVRANAPGINLQVAAFLSSENASALKDKLGREFPRIRIDELPAHGKTWYRVRVGPLATEAEADRAEERLRAMGHVPVRYGKPQRPD